MELKEYIDGARRTESSLLPLSEAVVNLGLTNRMYHGIVGIVTEVGEIVEAYEKDQIDFVNVAEEIGDAFWYTAVILDELNVTITETDLVQYDMNVLPKSLVSQSAEMLDKTKKTMFYGKEYSTDLLVKQIVHFYYSLIMSVNGLTEHLDITKEKVWDINLNKLKIRYPKKFNLNDAEVRDLETERVELEKVI